MLPDFRKLRQRIRDALGSHVVAERLNKTWGFVLVALAVFAAFIIGALTSSFSGYPSVKDVAYLQMYVRQLRVDRNQCRADLTAARQQSAAISMAAEAAAEQLTACLAEQQR